MAVLRRPRVRTGERGFTLTELMAVVAIMGILATLSITAFVRHSKSSKTGEALAVVQAIRAAEERYRSENQLYFGNSNVWYPSDGRGDTRYAFSNPKNADHDGLWKTLRPTVDRPVQFGYRVNSGLPGDVFPTVVTERKFVAGSKASEAWYVVQARADVDEDGEYCAVVATSFSPEVFVENDGE